MKKVFTPSYAQREVRKLANKLGFYPKQKDFINAGQKGLYNYICCNVRGGTSGMAESLGYTMYKKNVRRTPPILTDTEVNKIAETFLKSKNYPENKLGRYMRLRDRTIWLLLNYCGLRPKEAMQLRWSDVNFDERKIYLQPYWNKERNDTPAVLTLPAIKLLNDYQEKLKQMGLRFEDCFPSNLTWEPISTDWYRKKLLSIAKEAGVAKVVFYNDANQPKYNVKPYTGRHNFCTKVYKNTHSELAVMLLARHTDPHSAHFYVHLDNDDKVGMVDKIFNDKEVQKCM